MTAEHSGPVVGGDDHPRPPRSRAGRKKGAMVVAVVACALALAGWGWVWVSDRSESWDRRYSDCMATREPVLHAQNHYWPDDAVQQAMAECQGQPPPPAYNPDVWRAP